MAPGDVFIRPEKMLLLIASAPPVTPRVKVRRGDAEVNPDAPEELKPDSAEGSQADSPAGQLVDFINSVIAPVADNDDAVEPQPAEDMPDAEDMSDADDVPDAVLPDETPSL